MLSLLWVVIFVLICLIVYNTGVVFYHFLRDLKKNKDR